MLGKNYNKKQHIKEIKNMIDAAESMLNEYDKARIDNDSMIAITESYIRGLRNALKIVERNT